MVKQNERIYLRNLEEFDAYTMMDALNDEEIRYMTNTQIRLGIDDLKKHIVNINKDDSRYDFAICINSTNKVVGELSLMELDLHNESAHFRIALSSISNLNKGLGSEAILLALDYAFNDLKLNRVDLEVFSHNKRAIKAYKKCGFKKEGVLKQSVKINDVFSDTILMAILKEEYFNNK